MMRKVSLIGPSSLMVSLPSRWVKQWSVKKGDEVAITEKGKSLTVNLQKSTESSKVVLDVTSVGIFNKNFISDAYKAGYDELVVKGINNSIFEAIQERTSDLLGYEIMEQSESICVIRMVAKEVEEEFENILRKTFINLIEMSRECVLCVENKRFERLQNVRNLEKANNKYTDFCLRILNKHGAKNPNHTTFLYAIIRDLEKIGDEYKHICDVMLKDKTNAISPNVIKLFKNVNGYMDLFYAMFYKMRQEKVRRLYTQREELRKEGLMLLKAKKQSENLVTYHLLGVGELVFSLFGPYFTMSLTE